MEYYKDILCATCEDLLQVMTIGTMKTLLKRNKLTNIGERGGNGRKARYVYATLPELYRLRYESQVGDPKAMVIRELVPERVVLSTEALRYYREERRLAESLVLEYATNATVLDELIVIKNDRSAMHKALGNGRKNIWATMVLSSEELRKRYHHTLPEHETRLKEKITRYLAQGYDALISGKVGNANTQKITEDAGRYLIALKRSSVPVYTDTQIFNRYNAEAKVKGWKVLQSKSSLRQYFARPEIEPLWWDAVYGELSSSRRFGRKHSTELPSVRDSLWYGDGTKLNLYYKYYEPTGKLRMATTQVYEVIDAYSEVLLGFWISDTENHITQYHAFRMAMQTAGYKPYEIVVDNQGGHKKIKNFMQRLSGHVSRFTAPHRGQSKTIESLFGRFQAEVLHQDWRFTGMNITAKSEKSRPNLERIHANTDQLYTIEELKARYAAAREEWNALPHSATGTPRIEMYQQSVNPDACPISDYDMVEMFWIRQEVPSTYTDCGIKIEVGGKKYVYEVYGDDGLPDHAFLRKHMWRKFKVEYDPYDMTTVRLFEPTASGDRFVTYAKPYMRVHRNIQEQEAGDMSFIRAEQLANAEDRIQRQVDARIIELEHGMSMEEQGLKRPKLKGMSKKEQEEIERRVAIYQRKPEAAAIGEYGKRISLMTFDEIDTEVRFDERRVAAKY